MAFSYLRWSGVHSAEHWHRDTINLLMTSVCVSVAGVVHRLETDGSRYFENIFFWHKEGEGEGLHHHLGYY